MSQRAAAQRHAQALAQLAHVREVGVGVAPAQAVVQVRGVQREPELVRERRQRDEQRGGVGAAAHRDEQRAAVRQRDTGRAGPDAGPARAGGGAWKPAGKVVAAEGFEPPTQGL